MHLRSTVRREGFSCMFIFQTRQYISHRYFSFSVFLQFVAFRCRNPLIAVSYTRCREIFKTTLKDLGYDPKEYGLHSLRSGGTTAVINNNASKAVSERLLKLHGRWKTDEAKDMYVLEPRCNRLSVTKYLGI